MSAEVQTNTASRAVRNAMIMLVSQAMTFGLALVAMLVIPVYLGPERFGKLFFATVFTSLLSIGVDLGLDTFLLKEVPRRSGNVARLLANALAMKAVLFLALYGLGIGALLALGYDRETVVVTAIFMVSMLSYGWIKALTSVFQASDRFGDPTVGLITEKTLYTAGAVIVLVGGLAAGYDVAMVAAVFLAATVCHLAFLAWRVRAIAPLALGWDLATWRDLLAGTTPFLVWAVFSNIYLYIDGTMLSLMSSERALGWYGVAMRLYGTLLFIPHILNNVLVPALSKLHAGDAAKAVEAGRKAVGITLVLAAPVATGILLTADRVIALLYGLESYGPAVGDLRFLAAGLVPIYLSMILASWLIATDKQKQWSRMAIYAAFLNIGMNLVLIPVTERAWSNGGLGAAAATAFTETFALFYCFWLLPRGFFNRALLRTMASCAVSVAAMGASVLAVSSFGLAAMIASGAASYGLAILATGGVSRADIDVLAGTLRRRKKSPAVAGASAPVSL